MSWSGVMTTKPSKFETFDRWYFSEGYFCTPEGDRYTPEAIRACFFYRQLQPVSHLLHWRPEDLRNDCVMPRTAPSVDVSVASLIASNTSGGLARWRETRARAPMGDIELLALLTERLGVSLAADQPIVFHD